MTFMNKADPSEPDERAWPVWATIVGIVLLGGAVAAALVYRETGSLFGLDGGTAKAVVLLMLFGVSGLAWYARRRYRPS